MSRHEFPTAVKREALERSAGQCEAVGERYGFPSGVRCWRPVAKGAVNYEHWPRGAHDPHPETVTIGNCTAICPECNTHANNRHDTPREAKMKRVKHSHAIHEARMAQKAGLDVSEPAPKRKPRPKMRRRGFQRGDTAKIPSRPFPRRTK